MILVMVCTAFTVVNETVGAPAAGSFKYPRLAAVEESNDPLIRDILSFTKRRMLNGKTKPTSVGGNTEEANSMMMLSSRPSQTSQKKPRSKFGR